jgi:glycosyltransferase involved in cell wall biosynthesis
MNLAEGMRVGIIAPDELPVPPRGYGGIENMVDGLCRGLLDQGHEVTLVAAPGSRCPVPKVKITNSDPVIYALRAYDALAGRVDIIHDHTRAGFLIGDARGVPVIATNHLQFDDGNRLIYAEAARRGVGVVAISENHASTAGVPLIAWVHHGVDVASIPVGAGGGYVCTLGSMLPIKGVREAILIARSAGVPLKIGAKVQSPEEQRYFYEEIKPLLNGDVEYLREVSASEKDELLGGAMALLNPIQFSEPFGMTMIESLARGTPVLATLMGAAPEIVTHGVTGFVRHHWSMMSADVARVTSDIDRATCRQVAEERFGIARMASAYLELYQAQPANQAAA